MFKVVATALVATFALSASLIPAQAAGTPARNCAALRGINPDNDGTLDLAEAKAAGVRLFAKLNKDRNRDSTLTARELRGHLTAREVSAANPDHDGTIDAAEYAALVEQRFLAANPDRDGTVDCKEFGAKAGRALLKLLK